jgi:hypothetical protein
LEKKTALIYYLILCVTLVLLQVFRTQTSINSSNLAIINEKEFHALLKKHGLDKSISILEVSGDEIYFYRDGKKVRFK